MPTPSRLHRLAPAALALALLVGSAACSDGDTSADATTTAPPTDGAVAEDTTTTAAATEPSSSPPATPSQPTAHTATAADAVSELKAAWEAGDRARAQAIAPGDVVDALFAVPPDGFEVYGCDTGEFETSTCNYRNRSSGAFIKVTSARSDQGWQVATITVT